ncbi:MAG TPA: hypothetical protein VGZ93_06760 [Candidatus Methylacidiphilales bacterium]|jgi:hypothetical protein|nr:hypothetical protein [Candidatus Methylacidiphilales bacterium]
MRIALLTIVFIVGVTATARARLGETADQLVVRYGQPLSETDQKAEGTKVAKAVVVFQKGGFQITVTLVDGASVAEWFKKVNGEPLTTVEVRTLLTDNSQGHEWEAPQTIEDGTLWTRDDAAAARLARDGSLVIKSKELMSEEATAKKLERHPSLDGF